MREADGVGGITHVEISHVLDHGRVNVGWIEFSSGSRRVSLFGRENVTDKVARECR